MHSYGLIFYFLLFAILYYFGMLHKFGSNSVILVYISDHLGKKKKNVAFSVHFHHLDMPT